MSSAKRTVLGSNFTSTLDTQHQYDTCKVASLLKLLQGYKHATVVGSAPARRSLPKCLCIAV